MIVCARSEFAAFLGLALGLCGGGLGRQGHKDTRTLRIMQDLYCVMWTSGDTNHNPYMPKSINSACAGTLCLGALV